MPKLLAQHIRVLMELAEMPPSKNWMEVSIYVGLFLATIRQALGLEHLPRSLSYAGFPWGQIAAGAIALGCAISLFGTFWRNSRTGLPVYQFGLVFTGIGCMFYAVAVAVANGFVNGSLVIGIFVGCAVGCAAQYQRTGRAIALEQRVHDVIAQIEDDSVRIAAINNDADDESTP